MTLQVYEINADHQMAILWSAIADLADGARKRQGSGRAAQSWFKLKGFHVAALLTWMSKNDMEDMLGTMVFQVRSLSLSRLLARLLHPSLPLLLAQPLTLSLCVIAVRSLSLCV